MSLLVALGVILSLWALITLVRSWSDEVKPEGPTVAPGPADRDDEIDYEELERAEEEIRDLDVNARPEDGFEGDDWGPGVPKPPKPPLY